jgi:hypothetical protein
MVCSAVRDAAAAPDLWAEAAAAPATPRPYGYRVTGTQWPPLFT